MNILNTLNKWALYNNVDLDRAEIAPKSKYDSGGHTHTVTFTHAQETRENFRNIKRALEGKEFDKEGNAPYVELVKTVDISAHDSTKAESKRILFIKLEWKGALTCQKIEDARYSCTPATFIDDDKI